MGRLQCPCFVHLNLAREIIQKGLKESWIIWWLIFIFYESGRTKWNPEIGKDKEKKTYEEKKVEQGPSDWIFLGKVRSLVQKKMKYQNEPKRRNRWNTDCRCSCWKDVVLIKTLLVCGSNGSCTFSLLIARLHLVGTETIRRCFTDMSQHRRPEHWIHHQHTHSACTVFQRASSDGDCSTNWMGYGEVMLREHQPSLVDNRWFRHQLGNWLRGRTKQTAKELLIEYLRGHIIKPFQPLHHQHRNNIVVIVKEKKKIRWWNNKTPVETIPKIFLNFFFVFWPERCRRGASGREGQVRWPNDQLTWINRSDVFSVGRSEPASARHIVREPSHRHIKKKKKKTEEEGGGNKKKGSQHIWTVLAFHPAKSQQHALALNAGNKGNVQSIGAGAINRGERERTSSLSRKSITIDRFLLGNVVCLFVVEEVEEVEEEEEELHPNWRASWVSPKWRRKRGGERARTQEEYK